jgi:hypothetical protein
MSQKFCLAPSTEPPLRVRPSTEPPLDPNEVAEALGAERRDRPPSLLAPFPEDPTPRQAHDKTPGPEGHPNPLGLLHHEWDQLCALAAALGEGDRPPTPLQVARALVRRALAALSPGKLELKASLAQEPDASPRK